jgi:uncharacterized protein with FMN-binding domain
MAHRARPVLLLALLGASCIVHPRGGPLPLEGLTDGSYEASAVSFPNSATVRVQVRDGRMAEVALVKHNASRIGHACDDVLPARMVEQQSTVVDAVSGATSSSNVIMEAARRALEQAAQGD